MYLILDEMKGSLRKELHQTIYSYSEHVNWLQLSPMQMIRDIYKRVRWGYAILSIHIFVSQYQYVNIIYHVICHGLWIWKTLTPVITFVGQVFKLHVRPRDVMSLITDF